MGSSQREFTVLYFYTGNVGYGDAETIFTTNTPEETSTPVISTTSLAVTGETATAEVMATTESTAENLETTTFMEIVMTTG